MDVSHVYVYIYSPFIYVAISLVMSKQTWRNEKMRGAVVAVVSTIIMLFVGITVTVSFINGVTPDDTWSASANTTWSNAQTYTWTSYGLIAIGIIVLGAVAIMAALGGFRMT